MSALAYLTVTIESAGPCPTCGVEVTMPGAYLRKRREDGQTYYCINGHALCHRVNDLDKLRAELAREQAARKSAEQSAQAERDRRATAEKGQAIARGKLRAQSVRVANGVCPCCQRSFCNLARHMKTKHPSFTEQP